MPDEIISSTTPSDTAETVPSGKITRKKTTRAKPRRQTPPRASAPDDNDQTEDRFHTNDAPEVPPNPAIGASLEAIYRDDSGSVPDLKTLTIKKTSVAAGFFVRLLSVLIVLVAGGALSWYYLGSGGSTGENVTLAIDAPQNIVLGNPATLHIVFRNNEPVPLRSTVAQLYYPEGFVPVSASVAPTNEGKTEWLLGTIPAGEDRSLDIVGVFYAPVGTPQTVRALLTYRPENFTSTFQKNSQALLTTASGPLTASVAGPTQIVLGVPVTYTITLNRDGGTSPNGTVALQPLAMPGFTITSSSLPISKNGKVTVPAASFATSSPLKPIVLTGLWSDTGDDQATFSFNVLFSPPSSTNSFVIATASTSAPIQKNELSISVAANGATRNVSTRPGGDLLVTLHLTNNGASTLKKGVIKLLADGPANGRVSSFDWANVVDEHNGTVVGSAIAPGMRRGTITWTSAEISALATVKPNDALFIDIKIPVKNLSAFDWSSFASTSFSLKPLVDFSDSSGNPVHAETDALVIPLETDVALDVRDQVDSAVATTHHVQWILTNKVHPLKNIVCSASVFGSVTVTPPDTTPAGTLTYDKKKGVLTWKIPEMPATVDVLALPVTLSITKQDPTQTTLVSPVSCEATDEGNGSNLKFAGEAVTLSQ